MNQPETPDTDRGHLLPDFATRLHLALAEADAACKALWPPFDLWRVTEGYRSSARQAYLYAQGRTRPGEIVTQTSVPGYHGFGIAADCVPLDTEGKARYDAPQEVWEQYGHCLRAFGLEWGGDWESFPDRPHAQLNAAHRGEGAAYLRSIGLSVPSEGVSK